MPNLTKQQRAELVASLSLNAGQAEMSVPHVIFPIPEHARAIEPEVVLIVGDRGAGKTQLVRALEDDNVRAALVRRNASLRAPTGKTFWKTGWPLGIGGPDSSAWRNFARDPGRGREDVTAIWLAYLVRVLRTELDSEALNFDGLMAVPGVDAVACLQAYRQHSLSVTAALDRLDERLLQEERWLFIAYDELDTLVQDDWSALGTIIRGLVSLWAAYARRWRRIRPKIFLRSDFYRHHREIAGADVAKLASNRVELHWSDRNLYGALIKHVVNKRDAMGKETLLAHFAPVVRLDPDPVLGYVPVLADATEAKPFVERLVSEFMGAGRKKGLAFTWILDHLRDGNGRALPRALVRLVELAAEIERNQPRATGGHLLHHVSVRNALDLLSNEYVQQAETNELFWLIGLGERLARDREVPWSRRELLKLLSYRFDETWGAAPRHVAPPGQDPEEVIETLVQLGVLRVRPDGGFDVPDLYLDGLGLVRRGGVAKG